MGKLTNQVAVVTGASKGIGAGIAKALAAEGASVVVNYASSKADGERVVKEIIEKGGKAIAVQADVSKQADITRLFAETKKAYGKLNILVNNAGIYKFASLEAVTEELFHSQFNLNVLGLLLTSKEAVKLFGPEGGSIINVSSGASTILPPNTSIYSDQSVGGRDYRGSCQGIGAAEDSRELHQSRHDRNGGRASRWHGRRGFSQMD